MSLITSIVVGVVIVVALIALAAILRYRALVSTTKTLMKNATENLEKAKLEGETMAYEELQSEIRKIMEQAAAVVQKMESADDEDEEDEYNEENDPGLD